MLIVLNSLGQLRFTIVYFIVILHCDTMEKPDQNIAITDEKLELKAK